MHRGLAVCRRVSGLKQQWESTRFARILECSEIDDESTHSMLVQIECSVTDE
jgi:hypothetical protein